jgi:heparanase
VAQVVSLDPAKVLPVGTVDERFQSYNIEMVEIIGGRFWKPYSNQVAGTKNAQPPAQTSSTPVGMDPNLYQYRPPIDLSNARLRKWAAALAPAYVQISGTWANSVYFHDSDNPAPSNVPAGFSGSLTRKEWKSFIDFAQAVNAEIVTSFMTGPGTHNGKGSGHPSKRANCSRTLALCL